MEKDFWEHLSSHKPFYTFPSPKLSRAPTSLRSKPKFLPTVLKALSGDPKTPTSIPQTEVCRQSLPGDQPGGGDM